MKINKNYYLIFIISSVLIVGFVYGNLLEKGRFVYETRSQEVNQIVSQNPDFFKLTFTQIFDSAIGCNLDPNECKANTSQAFLNYLNASNQLDLINQPIYFIKLLPDGKIAKLFFSGDLIIEEVNNREEKLVVSLLEGKRNTLYGPYFGSEVFKINENGKRRFYDLKPRYLKDLYSQMEVIVPYYSQNQITGAIVYLHGQ